MSITAHLVHLIISLIFFPWWIVYILCMLESGRQKRMDKRDTKLAFKIAEAISKKM